MKTIISATDFSKSAINASKYAAALSAELQAELLLIHVIDIPLAPLQNSPLGAEIDEPEIEKKTKLYTIREQLLFYTDNQISVRTELVYGPAESAINNLCVKINPLALIMGCRNNNKSDSSFMGSFGAKVSLNLEFPILIVFEKTSYKSLKKAGVLSDEKKIPLEINFELLKKYNAKFSISYQFISQKNTWEQASFKNTADTTPVFPHYLAELSGSGGHCFDGGLLDFLEREHPDLITIISGKHKLLKHFNHSGSQGPIPVLQQGELLLLSIPIPINQRVPESGAHPVYDIKNCKICDGDCCSKKKKNEPVKLRYSHPE